MKNNEQNSETLKEEIELLKGRIDSLEKILNRLAKSNFDSNQVIRQHLDLIDRDQENAFGRIKNIELKVFPNLAEDIVDLNRIIGDGEDNSDNPLDRRKP